PGHINVYLTQKIVRQTREGEQELGGIALTDPDGKTIVLGDNADGWILAHEMGHNLNLPDIETPASIQGVINNLKATHGDVEAVGRMLMAPKIRQNALITEGETKTLRDNGRQHTAFVKLD
ncbi:MAG: hypothetical protein ACK44W_00605, partial [Planctomycetota bacterium]